MTINIQKEIKHLHDLGLLDALLADRTTGENILWVTDAYEKLGPDYERYKQIKTELITGEHIDLIKPRAQKEREQQNARKRKVAEIFTPLKLCKFMVDNIDKAWYESAAEYEAENAANEEGAKPKKKTWRDYINTTIMEITCGEAPFLVSRYDVTTGEEVPLKDRIGVLDRKLRKVNEHTGTEKTWMVATRRAFGCTYGYELLGDSLLIARINLLMTFEDYLKDRWDREPTLGEYKKIIDVITWNVWQMDGLSGTVPNGATPKAASDADQMSLFDIDEPKEEQKKPIYCKMKFWRANNVVVEYESLKEGR